MESEVNDINLQFMNSLEGKNLESFTGTVRKSKNNIRDNTPNDKLMHSNHTLPKHGRKSPNNNSIAGINMKKTPKLPEPNINLSREELLKLLSVFEGELQARDEVIAIFKAERTNNPDIHSRYGLCNMPLTALQRDSSTLEVTMKDQVGEQTQEQLKKIIQHQKDSHRKVKQMLLASEHTNQCLTLELEEAKKTHQDYINKSEDFVSLLGM